MAKKDVPELDVSPEELRRIKKRESYRKWYAKVGGRKEYNRIYQRKWRKTKQDELRKYMREYMKIWRKSNRPKIYEQEKRYKENNKEKCKEWKKKAEQNYRNTPKGKATAERFRKTEKGKLLAIKCVENRRAAGNLSVQEVKNILQMFGGACAYCEKIGKLHLDHIVPVVRGGRTIENNLLPACAKCNSSKGKKEFFSWFEQQEFYSPKVATFVRRKLG